MKNSKSIIVNAGCCIFSVFNILIYMIDSNANFSDKVEVIILLCDIVVLSIICQKIFYWLVEKKDWRELLLENHDSSEKNNSYKIYYLFITLIQIIAWLLVLISYYPGITVYDYPVQITQTLGSYSTHHPLVHTLYIQLFNRIIGGVIGSTTKGIFIGTLIQIIIFSMMLSTVHLYLYYCGIKKRYRYFFVAITSLWPFISLIAIANIKDVFFIGFFAMSFVGICLYHTAHDIFINSKTFKLLYILAITGMILFRNNGKYVVFATLIWTVIMWLVGKRRFYNMLLVLTLLGFVSGSFINGAIKTVLNAEDGSLNEALSIPYQQIAAVYVEDYNTLPEEERTQIQIYMPTVVNYTPYISDPVKGYATGDEDLIGLVKLWAKLGVKYPKTYIKSFLELDAGYLGLTNISYAYIKDNGLIETTPEGTEHQAGNIIFITFEKLFTDNEYIHGFILRNVCKPSLYIWGIVFVFVVSLVKKKYCTSIAFTFLGTFVLTLLAGPCVLVRYSIPCIVCLPCYICLVLKTEGDR